MYMFAKTLRQISEKQERSSQRVKIDLADEALDAPYLRIFTAQFALADVLSIRMLYRIIANRNLSATRLQKSDYSLDPTLAANSERLLQRR